MHKIFIIIKAKKYNSLTSDLAAVTDVKTVRKRL